MDKKINNWDNENKGILIRYNNLKILKKLVEIIDEQDYLNIPISYNAEYFFPDKCDKIGNLIR